MKCQSCRKTDAMWAWQPFGPDDDPGSFTTLGSHYRGFPVIKMCDECKNTIQAGEPGVMFYYKNIAYFALNRIVKRMPF